MEEVAFELDIVERFNLGLQLVRKTFLAEEIL